MMNVCLHPMISSRSLRYAFGGLFLVACCLMLATGFSSCQNDEYIGDIYGQWQLTDIQTPDTTATPRNLYLAFQSNVVMARIVGVDAHYTETLQGTWQQSDDSLFLSFYCAEAQADYLQSMLRTLFVMDAPAGNLRFNCHLSSTAMTLTQGKSQWQFRKF